MHYSGENMHKTILFLHKSEKYAKQWKFGLCICVKMYILSIKMCKEHEEGDNGQYHHNGGACAVS